MIPPITLPPQPTIASMAVLVVDDSNTMRRIIIKNLKALGFTHIRQAPDASAAWTMLRISHVDFILCDWNMPGMKGIELLQRVRKDPKLCDALFLMVSAEAQPEYILEAIRKGVTNYLTKPFSKDEFMRKVAAVLHSQQHIPPILARQYEKGGASASP